MTAHKVRSLAVKQAAVLLARFAGAESQSLSAGTDAHPDWAGLIPDLWRHVLVLAMDRWKGYQAEWCRLLVRAAATDKSLRSALLGRHVQLQLCELHIQSSYATPPVQPQRLSRLRAALSLHRAPCMDLAQRSQGLTRFLTGHMRHAGRATVRGGNWALPQLREACASLTESPGKLRLLDIDAEQEAACISSALAGSGFTNMFFGGTQPIVFPAGVQVLTLFQHLTASSGHAQRVFDSLQPLRQLADLYLVLGPEWRLTPAHAQRLMQQHPHLRWLTLQLIMSETPYPVAFLACLLPAISVDLVVVMCHDSKPARRSLSALLLQLRGLSLAHLEIHSPSAAVTADVEEQLAQCNIRGELSLYLHGKPCRRLQHLPADLQVVYKTRIQVFGYT